MRTKLAQHGFSLLEILIAFAILALSLGILLRIFSGGVHTAQLAERYTLAAQIAESLMAKTGVETPLENGETSGIVLDDYHWRVTVNPYVFNPEQTDLSQHPFLLFQVNVRVTWDEDTDYPRQLVLSTLKLQSKISP
jgi:general secretion pathway protein I